MNFSKLVKENLALTLGLTVPVLLMAIFFVMTAVTRPTAPSMADIRYDILLIENGNYSSGFTVNAEVFVENGALYTRYSRPQNHGQGNMPKLYLYEASTKKMRRLDFPPPDTSDESIFDKKILIESTKDMKLDTALTSPDGYEFTYGSDGYNRGGIINELFIGGGRSYNYGPRLRKDGVTYPLPNNSGKSYFTDISLLGWVVK